MKNLKRINRIALPALMIGLFCIVLLSPAWASSYRQGVTQAEKKGVAALKSGNLKAARNAYESALGVLDSYSYVDDSDFYPSARDNVNKNLIEIYFKLGDTDRAAERLEDYLAGCNSSERATKLAGLSKDVRSKIDESGKIIDSETESASDAVKQEAASTQATQGTSKDDSDSAGKSEVIPNLYSAPPLPTSTTGDIAGATAYGEYLNATFEKAMALPEGAERTKLWTHLVACGEVYYPYVRYKDSTYWNSVTFCYRYLLNVMVYGYFELHEYKKSYDWYLTSLCVKVSVAITEAMKNKFKDLVTNKWTAPIRPVAPTSTVDSSLSSTPKVISKGDMDQNGVLDDRDIDEFFESYPSLKTYKAPFMYPDREFGSWLGGGFEVIAKESSSAYDPAFDFNQDKKIGLKDLFMLKALISCQSK